MISLASLSRSAFGSLRWMGLAGARQELSRRRASEARLLGNTIDNVAQVIDLLNTLRGWRLRVDKARTNALFQRIDAGPFTLQPYHISAFIVG